MTMTDAIAFLDKANQDLKANATKIHEAYKAHANSQHALEEVSAAYEDARNRVADAMANIHANIDQVS